MTAVAHHEGTVPSKAFFTPTKIAKLAVAGCLIFAVMWFMTYVIPQLLGWSKHWYDVDRDLCTCGCWEARNQMNLFATKPDINSNTDSTPTPDSPKDDITLAAREYRTVFYNSDSPLYKIAVITLFYGYSCYLLASRVVSLAISSYRNCESLTDVVFGPTPKRGLRLWVVLIVLPPLFYSNLYGFWMYYHYLNDRFLRYMWHQTFFSITEYIVMVLASLLLLDSSVRLTLEPSDNASTSPDRLGYNDDTEYQQEAKVQSKVLLPNKRFVISKKIGYWLMAVISLSHIVQSSVDQFVSNVLLGKGKNHQNARDIGFLLCDCVTLVVAFGVLLRQYLSTPSLHSRTQRLRTLIRDALLALFALVVTLIAVSLFLPRNED